MTMTFSGFDRKFFAFFKELKANNNREWFNKNKPRYEDEVVTPIMAFIEAIQAPLKKVSPHFVANPKKQGGSMFRIYRDVRFSKDKRPYKEHAACQFRHALGKDAHAPGFYVHLEAGNVLAGGGIWMPPSDKLKAIRDKIAKDGKQWQRIVGNKKIQDMFKSLHGDALTRPPRGFSAEDPNIEDIKRKSFFLMRSFSNREAGNADFVQETIATFRTAAPLMKFLCAATHADY